MLDSCVATSAEDPFYLCIAFPLGCVVRVYEDLVLGVSLRVVNGIKIH